jgi:AraC-like DNA-binding protein
MSRPQLYRKLQILTGLSVQEFIKSFRLKKAAAFLRSGEQRISDVAYQTGFSDPQHFSKSFKNQFGISPSQYAAENRV